MTRRYPLYKLIEAVTIFAGKFSDTKRVIKSRKSRKDRQYNDQKEKVQKDK